MDGEKASKGDTHTTLNRVTLLPRSTYIIYIALIYLFSFLHFSSMSIMDRTNSRSLLRDEARLKLSDRTVKRAETRSASASCSCRQQNSKGYYKAVEFACSACLFCVSCPLSIAFCCIKLPCKIGCRAAKYVARHWICCQSEKKFYAEYSSFSDIEEDIVLPRKVGRYNSSGSSRSRMSCRNLL